MPRAYTSIPIEQRFWNKVKKTNSCWIWTGGTACSFGYGILSKKNSFPVLAHRFSYEIHKGEIPKGMCILHLCDNPVCVNPKHLKIGTHRENMIDAKNKGRMNRGEKNARSILRSRHIPMIRNFFEKGLSHSKIGNKFGVHRRTISDIILHKTWVHIN